MADQPLTLQEIGNRLRLSKERVRQIEGEAILKLKANMGDRKALPGPDSSPPYCPIPTLEKSRGLALSLRQEAFQQRTLS